MRDSSYLEIVEDRTGYRSQKPIMTRSLTEEFSLLLIYCGTFSKVFVSVIAIFKLRIVYF